jgi:hypothetical protein
VRRCRRAPNGRSEYFLGKAFQFGPLGCSLRPMVTNLNWRYRIRLIDEVAHPLAAWLVNKINHLISTLGTRPLTGSLSF